MGTPVIFRLAGLVALVLAPVAVRAQAPLDPTHPDPQIVALFSRISERVARVTPMLDQVRTADWTAKGAPAAYEAQLESMRAQMTGIATDLLDLSRQSTASASRVQDTLKALFRIQGYHRSLDSLLAGLRKYQNTALADLIQSVAAEDAEDLGRMQDYILDLANQKEQECLVADHEAQRCRAAISKEPVRAPASPARPKN